MRQTLGRQTMAKYLRNAWSQESKFRWPSFNLFRQNWSHDTNLNIITMPYKYKRVCPVCQRHSVIHLSSHLEMVHDLNANERSDYLKRAMFCANTPSGHARVPNTTVTAKLKSSRQKHDWWVVQQCQKYSYKTPTTDALLEPFPYFRLRHKFSGMVVGPSMSGKSYFVKELLERDCIEYEDHRKRPKTHWFYGQYQDMFKDMKRSLWHDIQFRERLFTFQLDLSDIDPKYNSIIVLDDLMDLGTCVSYAFPSASKSQTLEKRLTAQMNSEQGIA